MRASVGFPRLLRNALENVCCEHHTPAAVLKLCLRSGRDLHRCEFTNDLRASLQYLSGPLLVGGKPLA